MACEKLGLIGDDLEWSTTLQEAGQWATSKELRALFAHILLFCDVANPLKLWQEHWRLMGEDISYRFTASSSSHSSSISDYSLQQHVLLELEQLLNSCSTSRTLAEFSLPLPDMSSISSVTNRLILEERSYDLKSLASEHVILSSALNVEQRSIYDEVMSSNVHDKQILLFIYGHGGTGKTYLWRTLIAGLRSKEQIVLAVAASGIASLLLPSGRTAHSRFKLPLDLTEESVCYVKKNTQLSQLLLETSLIIRDEAPMSDRRSFESLDRTLRDIIDNGSQPFGGKSVLLGGDFRQTLHVNLRATKSQIISSCLPSSYLWSHFRVYKLFENMRLLAPNLDNTKKAEIERFSMWLLAIGDGNVGEATSFLTSDSKRVTIPPQFLLHYEQDGMSELINFVYDCSVLQHPTVHSFSDRAIICPKNETVDHINDLILSSCPGDPISFLSTDSMIPHAHNGGDVDALYPVEYLNMLSITGVPNHNLVLKKNTPIMQCVI